MNEWDYSKEWLDKAIVLGGRVKEANSRESEGRKEEGKQKEQNKDLPKQEGAMPDSAGSRWKVPQEVHEPSFFSGDTEPLYLSDHTPILLLLD